MTSSPARCRMPAPAGHGQCSAGQRYAELHGPRLPELRAERHQHAGLRCRAALEEVPAAMGAIRVQPKHDCALAK